MDHNKEYSAKYLADVLASVKTIAMVGASPDPTKFSYGVLRVLHEQGFEMFPINNKPEIKEIRGIKVFPTLDAVDQPVDMVQVFRKSEALYGVAEEAINIGAKVLWGQIGVFNEDAANLAESAGMQVVMNRCPKIELFRPFWKPKLGLGI
ncbi:MAG: CoA-binding protein [Paracoccaceae bacterium]|jgi:predicted CoA-binding protein|nr:CoA-binding protein [Paracoccaceae bacterium]|tara:strand:- start:10489 stop:10938 length:450 start_codon:yes stop_codon:yes gene_type:complete